MTEVRLLLRQRQAIGRRSARRSSAVRGPAVEGGGAAGRKIVPIAVETPTGHVQRGFGRARIRVDGAWTLTDTA